MEKLRNYLNSIPQGKVTEVSNVESLLAQCWNQIEGYLECGMAGYKLLGRTENMEWDPPNLHFTIERNGAIKFGSSRAELQHWSVDVETGTAGYATGIRQKYAREPSLKTKPLAEKIVKLILEKKDCTELKWDENKTHVRIIAGQVIPNDVTKQTLVGRRKRFRRDLTELLKSSGWQEVGPNKYRFMPSCKS